MRRPYKETHDVSAAVCRLVKAIGKRVAQEDLEDLRCLDRVQHALDQAWAIAVEGLRQSGYTDRQIGQALGGITKQSVAERWPRVST